MRIKSKKVKFPEVKRLLKKHKLIYKFREIDKDGIKTTYYIVRRKTEQEKYDELIEMGPFN